MLKSMSCLDTNRLPWQRLCVRGILPIRLFFYANTRPTCYRFLLKLCNCRRGSTLIHKFPGHELCTCWQFHFWGPMWRLFHPEIRLPKVHMTNQDCQHDHCGLQSCYFSSFWQYRRLWFVRYCFRWPACCHRKMTQNKCNRLGCLSHIVLSLMLSILTISKAQSPVLQQSGSCLTSPIDSGRSRLADWEPPKFCKAFYWSSWISFMLSDSCSWAVHRNRSFLSYYSSGWSFWPVWYWNSWFYDRSSCRWVRGYFSQAALHTWYNGSPAPIDYTKVGRRKNELGWEWTDRLRLVFKDFPCFSCKLSLYFISNAS